MKLLSFIGSITLWWRNWQKRQARLSELANCDDQEQAYIARDMGVTARELKALAGKSADSASLAYRRMKALRIDPEKLARAEGLVLRDIQRVCSMCENKGRCEHDLDHDERSSAWQSYCPNAQTLTALEIESETAQVAKHAERRKRRAAQANIARPIS